MPTFAAADLLRSITDAFVSLGTAEVDARIVADHLVDAELCGVKSHGIIRVPQYVRAVREGRVLPNAKATVVRETVSTAALDGGRGFGQVMVLCAADKAMELASRTGVGVATLVNCGHTGRLGHYTEHAARRGFAAMTMVNAGGHGQWVAPFGGREGRLATNPISIAAPSAGEFPLMLDIATSIAPEGRIRTLLTEGKSAPEGWIIRPDGQPTTQPAELYGPPRGAILPFGGHKGFGLGILVDALAGGLSGAGCCTDAAAPMDGKTDGVFFFAIQPGAFLPAELFLQQVRQLIDHVKSSAPLPGASEVFVPGEQEWRTRRKQEREGIVVEDDIWKLIQPYLAEAI